MKPAARRSHTVITIPAPPGFHFWRTVYSHGWCDLPPFAHDPNARTLSRVLGLKDGSIVATTLRSSGKAVRVEVTSAHRLTALQKQDIRQQLAACLRLDDDLRAFHRDARRYPHYRWIARAGAGRLLRAPTVFEDVVKMICTTNCSWSLTRIMVRNLVECFGRKFDASLAAFPTPEAIAGSSERYLRTEIKSGYRSPYLLELAEKVAAGRLDIEAWRTLPLSSEELFKQVSAVKGIGPYAAANILKLLGRYDYLGLDSWVRAQYARLHRNGQAVKDSTIEKHYAALGRWRGLFFWLEMTRHWHDEKFTFG